MVDRDSQIMELSLIKRWAVLFPSMPWWPAVYDETEFLGVAGLRQLLVGFRRVYFESVNVGAIKFLGCVLRSVLSQSVDLQWFCYCFGIVVFCQRVGGGSFARVTCWTAVGDTPYAQSPGGSINATFGQNSVMGGSVERY